MLLTVRSFVFMKLPSIVKLLRTGNYYVTLMLLSNLYLQGVTIPLSITKGASTASIKYSLIWRLARIAFSLGAFGVLPQLNVIQGFTLILPHTEKILLSFIWEYDYNNYSFFSIIS